ncbi:WAS/WASL-interacting protein family member 1-like [Strigops habroptila]|uniref:WAS/WASL-interacting protein family member 1-like n=1 Tax=Strigops habroptila TaxID=2489341 RepID=UPI001402838B|nr:WAS/WASL-interacting protein family member 1-like [Strigops habroptila]
MTAKPQQLSPNCTQTTPKPHPNPNSCTQTPATAPEPLQMPPKPLQLHPDTCNCTQIAVTAPKHLQSHPKPLHSLCPTGGRAGNAGGGGPDPCIQREQHPLDPLALDLGVTSGGIGAADGMNQLLVAMRPASCLSFPSPAGMATFPSPFPTFPPPFPILSGSFPPPVPQVGVGMRGAMGSGRCHSAHGSSGMSHRSAGNGDVAAAAVTPPYPKPLLHPKPPLIGIGWSRWGGDTPTPTHCNGRSGATGSAPCRGLGIGVGIPAAERVEHPRSPPPFPAPFPRGMNSPERPPRPCRALPSAAQRYYPAHQSRYEAITRCRSAALSHAGPGPRHPPRGGPPPPRFVSLHPPTRHPPP